MWGVAVGCSLSRGGGSCLGGSLGGWGGAAAGCLGGGGGGGGLAGGAKGFCAGRSCLPAYNDSLLDLFALQPAKHVKRLAGEQSEAGSVQQSIAHIAHCHMPAESLQTLRGPSMKDTLIHSTQDPHARAARIGFVHLHHLQTIDSAGCQDLQHSLPPAAQTAALIVIPHLRCCLPCSHAPPGSSAALWSSPPSSCLWEAARRLRHRLLTAAGRGGSAAPARQAARKADVDMITTT